MNDDRPTHAVKAVITNQEGKILFLQRKADAHLKVIPNWDFPGGIVERGEEDRLALRREVQEELSVDSEIGDEIGRWTFFRPFDQKMVDVTNYAVKLLSTDITLSSEHVDYKWVTFEEARHLPVKDQSIFSALGLQPSPVPFVSNTADNTHCLQAAYMSIAKHFDKNFSIAMDEWSRLTGYEEGLGTWANAGLVWFKENGYEVLHYEAFDIDEFIKRPKEYMMEVHGEEAGLWGYEHTNIDAEIPRMKKMVGANITRNRRPTIEDVKHYIDDGYLVRVTVNAGRLSGSSEYTGHAVVVTAYDDTHIQFHDPGLPALPNRLVTLKEFEFAWFDQEPELDAIRLAESA